MHRWTKHTNVRTIRLKNMIDLRFCMICLKSLHGLGAMLHVGKLRLRIPMRSLISFSNFIIIPIITMALGFTQSLIEMSTRRSFWVKARQTRKADKLSAIWEPISRQCGILNIPELYRPLRPNTEIVLVFYFDIYETRGSVMVKALCYQPEGREFVTQ
jgi:hypothetical protein